nr:MAG TPA: hypothetical protein [Caudoviricetes sp.]
MTDIKPINYYSIFAINNTNILILIYISRYICHP